MYGIKNKQRRFKHKNIDDGVFWRDALCHWGVKEDHKYIAKVRISNGKYRYFYDKEEYAAYLKNKQASNDKASIGADSDNSKNQSQNSFLPDILNSVLPSSITQSPSFMLGKRAVSDAVNLFNAVFNTTSNKSSDEPSDTNLKPASKILEYATLDAGREALSDAINLPGGASSNDHKYVTKVQLPNGEYRYFYDQKEYDSYMERQRYQENEPDFMKNLSELDSDYDSGKDIDKTNPNYSMYSSEYSTNCWFCSNAYELRKRGYDVEASAMTSDKHHLTEVKFRDNESLAKSVNENAKRWYKNPVTNPIENSNDIETVIRNNSDRDSRGQLTVMWKYGGGHSMVYEVDRHKNVTIVDSQTHKTYKGDDIKKLSNCVKYAAYTRTDNLALEEGILDVVDEKRKR